MSHGCNAHLDRARITLAAVVASVALLLAGTASAAPDGRVHSRTRLRVVVPDRDNLQLLAFWVARGAGYFEAAGVDIDLVVPTVPALAQSQLEAREASAAILPAPMIARMVAEKFPLVVVANLLENDPIDLVLPRALAEARGVADPKKPLAERLRGLHGLKIGIAPGPPPRLRALFASQGLDADREIEMVTIAGPQQNAALAEKKVDGLYAHTPFLERALLDQDAVVVVDQAGGEVPSLAHRQIHALVAMRGFAQHNARVLGTMVDAIARAETLVHENPGAATDAVLRALPAMDRRHVAKLVELYRPAVPLTPRPLIDGITRELPFTPAGGPPPDFKGIELATYTDTRFADRKLGGAAGGARFSKTAVLVALALATAAVVALLALLGEFAKKRAGDTSL